MKTTIFLACLLLTGCAGVNWHAFGNGLTQMSYNQSAPVAFYTAQDQANDEETANRVQDALSPITGIGSVQVSGYYRKDGTYVRPHTRTAPDGIEENNLSY